MSEPVNVPATAADFLGKPITAGATVCYPVRRGSRMWLKKLTVLAVQDTPKGVCVSGTNDAGRRISIRNLDNCVVVNSPSEESK
jgi:hypothetical protein